MLNSTLVLTIVIVVLALSFDFINGFHDCANAIATSVATRVLTMRQAVVMSATLNFIGALLFTSVAKTVGSDILNGSMITPKVVMSALIAAIIWDIITWYYGLPSSSSHALIGGLLGSAIIFSGSFSVVLWDVVLSKIVLWLFLSPIIGFVCGYIIMNIINFIFRKTRPAKVSKIFSKAQILSAAAMAFNHGANDAQKSMGVITMALLSAGYIAEFHVHTWVIVSCATAMAAGTFVGGSKIIKTVGTKMAKLAPVNGFAAELSGAIVIFLATVFFHAPVSTTHTITTSIMGVGASKRVSSVKWTVVNNILVAWILTIPACALIAGITMYLIDLI